jgi:uncharacterized protein
MEIRNTFDVTLAPKEAFALLLDVPRIAKCMPGATLTTVEGDTFTGTVRVKLGPVSITYAGEASIQERDDEALRAVIAARGKETRGTGDAKATVQASLEEIEGGTRVVVLTDLAVTGKPAQLGRGLIADVSGKLIGQFAAALAADIESAANNATPARDQAPDTAPCDPGSAGVRATAPAPANEIDMLALVTDRIPRQYVFAVAVFLVGWFLGRGRRR